MLNAIKVLSKCHVYTSTAPGDISLLYYRQMKNISKETYSQEDIWESSSQTNLSVYVGCNPGEVLVHDWL